MHFTKTSVVLSFGLMASQVAGHAAVVKAVGDAGGQGSAIGGKFSFQPSYSASRKHQEHPTDQPPQLTPTLPVTELAANPSSRTPPASVERPPIPAVRPLELVTTMSRLVRLRSCS